MSSDTATAERPVVERVSSVFWSAVAHIVNPEGQVLLRRSQDVPRTSFRSYWSLPGGICSPGETPQQAIVRHAQTLGIDMPCTTEGFTIPDGPQSRVTLYFRRSDGRVSTRDEELRWVDVAALADLPLDPLSRVILLTPVIELLALLAEAQPPPQPLSRDRVVPMGVMVP